MTAVRFYEVGGCVRDEIMGLPSSHDVDYTVVAPSWETMVEVLKMEGFRMYQVKPEFYTVRAGVPDGSPLRARTNDADFVWARKDGAYTDGRRPDWVEPGSLLDDLARRDFTMNAIAKVPDTGDYFDPFSGIHDIEEGVLRFVGDPYERIAEDGLRVMRGFRFMVTKGVHPDGATRQALDSYEAAQALNSVSIERIRDELNKMLAADTLDTIHVISHMAGWTKAAIFRSGLHLEATLKGVAR